MAIRPGFSGTVLKIRLMPRTNLVPNFSPFLFYFLIAFSLPDNILYNGVLLDLLRDLLDDEMAWSSKL